MIEKRMSKSFYGILIFLFFVSEVTPQSGNGHNPELTLSYISNKMRQDNGAGLAKNIINDNNAAKLYVNFTYETFNKNVYLQYTTNGSTPSKSNGSTLSASFDNYSDPNRTFYVLLPAQPAGTTVKYIFYISDGDLASSWGMVDSGNGYVTTWDEGSISPFSYHVFSEISSNTTWNASTTLSQTRYELTSNATLTVENTDISISDLSIYNGSTLTIEKSGSLNISGTLTNIGAIVMNSASNEYSSLIAGSKAGSGTYTYNKFISTVATNDLISAPFNGQAFNDFYATLSPYAIFRNPGGNQNAVLFGRFNNNTGVYTNNHVSGDNISTGQINAGEGFRVGSGIYKEDFSSSQFYNDTDGTYLLKNKSGKWGAAVDWEVDNTAETTYVSANFKKAVMKHGFSGLSQGDKITIRLELSIEGSDDTSGNYPIGRFGFSTANTTGWANTNSNFIFLSKDSNNLVIKDNTNDDLDTNPTNYDQFQTASHLNNNYILEVSLTIGADASNSTMSGNLTNADNLSQETGEGIHNGLDYSGTDTGIYNAVTGSDGIYLVMQSQGLSNITSGKLIIKDLSLYVNDKTLPFTGTFETSDVTEPISLGTDATYGRWNLIGNPFPSYLDLYHFFDDNDSNIESGTYNAVYTYDGDDSNGSVWTTYNLSNVTALGQYYIAPGQAFFVAASSGSANVSFDTDMQSTAGTDDFLPGERRPNDDSFAQNASSSNSKISLALSFDDSKYAATDIYLNTKASSGLDVGYDAGTFANQAGSLGLYSFLADGSHPETKLAIQAVSNNISDPVVIPLGVNAQSGIDYTIKLKERPQQEGVFIYLKDKLDNSMTLLTDEDYSFNTSTDLQGDGRFEVHLSAFALSTFDISKAPYSMIGLSGKVQVTGELSKGDVITILDLRGRTLAKQTVNNPTQSTTVQLNGVSKGVYIGKVENNIGQYNTKFILK